MFEPKSNSYNSRTDFESNFNKLAELINRGQMKFPRNAQNIKSLTKISKLPNNRIDLNTIDELARTSAMMAGSMEQMKEMGEKHEKK